MVQLRRDGRFVIDDKMRPALRAKTTSRPNWWGVVDD
jgi:hypothetical protein